MVYPYNMYINIMSNCIDNVIVYKPFWGNRVYTLQDFAGHLEDCHLVPPEHARVEL